MVAQHDVTSDPAQPAAAARRRRGPLKRADYSVVACGVKGHVTYAPDEPPLAERLRADSAAGESWRCLRCGSFVPGPPVGSGPADEAPIVLRGKALQDATILRVLAVERFLRGLFLLVLAYGVYRFDGSRDAIQRVLDDDLPLLEPFGRAIGVDIAASGPVHFVEKALTYQHRTLVLLMVGVVAYGLLQLVEGTGLWLLKRWGEYVAVVATSAFVPYELYEVVERVSVFKAVLLLVNIAAVVYLLWSKRLFGIRGGRAAHEAHRHETSLLEVERAALADGTA